MSTAFIGKSQRWGQIDVKLWEKQTAGQPAVDKSFFSTNTKFPSRGWSVQMISYVFSPPTFYFCYFILQKLSPLVAQSLFIQIKCGDKRKTGVKLGRTGYMRQGYP